MKYEPCDLIKNGYIPKEELERVFRESECASAEIDITFLCFEDAYQEVLKHTNKNDVIIDLGCSYDAQCFYFTNYKRYIAIDLPFDYGNDVRFDNGHVELYLTSIQDFIKNILPKLNLNLNEVMAVCNAVPDDEARQMVADTFPRHYVCYPGLKDNIAW